MLLDNKLGIFITFRNNLNEFWGFLVFTMVTTSGGAGPLKAHLLNIWNALVY